MEDKPLPLYGDGQNVRDWLHVLDHCLAIDTVLHRGQLGEIYNVGGGNERSNLEIVHCILHALGKDTTLIRYVPDRPGHDRRYALDCQKIRRLGFTPQQTFEVALAATIQWYRNHEGWWRPIKDGTFREYYQRMYEGQGYSTGPVPRHERVIKEEQHCEASV
jgi:dTDP-glucose 4,6-dehydratase